MEQPPFTYRIDSEWTMSVLDYEEMMALARNFERWAFDEPNIDADRRTVLIELASDYEAVAAFCGSSWKASIEAIDDPIVFVARQVLRCQRRDAAWSAYLDRRPSYSR